MIMQTAVLGMGSWGTALARVLANNGHQVNLWGRDQALVDYFNQTQVNAKYLNNCPLPQTVTAMTDMKQAVADSQMILIVVPTKAIRSVCDQLNQVLGQGDATQPLIVHATKGIEVGTHLRVSQMIKASLSADTYRGLAVLSGPSHAEEVGQDMLTMVTIAAQNLDTAQEVQAFFMNPYFRVYTNTDMLGVELGGALKNIIAITSGMIDGLGYGDNSRAALLTRGLAEITRLGVALGADPLTFMGLSGLGDLIVTATSQHSRNYRAGRLLGQGYSIEETRAKINMAIEGLNTCQAAFELAKDLEIEMPITQALYKLLYEGEDVQKLVYSLMTREGKSEAKIEDHLGDE
ncbi:NAD(P)H-dependent glycerol-3-phosphate dehydrogenase [Eremococcus coleocola]|uniref:NAD(P)H-dependent glycerol-3-phosphate dehydrogenase n=1 Tax=Eremococcus coleocola TaxID=88132 RepID=UPI0024A95F01|nr:NAD(P)H-dependent glycerol-3-phosphate dehydrogenase [Eremococcus coleocola]